MKKTSHLAKAGMVTKRLSTPKPRSGSRTCAMRTERTRLQSGNGRRKYGTVIFKTTTGRAKMKPPILPRYGALYAKAPMGTPRTRLAMTHWNIGSTGIARPVAAGGRGGRRGGGAGRGAAGEGGGGGGG